MARIFVVWLFSLIIASQAAMGAERVNRVWLVGCPAYGLEPMCIGLNNFDISSARPWPVPHTHAVRLYGTIVPHGPTWCRYKFVLADIKWNYVHRSCK